MTKLFTYIALFFIVGLFTCCSQVLQTVDLDINSEDSSLQEEFNVVEKTLTIKEATAQKATPYLRVVLKNGRGENAQDGRHGGLPPRRRLAAPGRADHRARHHLHLLRWRTRTP